MYKSYLCEWLPQLDRPGTLRTMQLVHDICLKEKKGGRCLKTARLGICSHYNDFSTIVFGHARMENARSSRRGRRLSMPAGCDSDSGNYK